MRRKRSSIIGARTIWAMRWRRMRWGHVPFRPRLGLDITRAAQWYKLAADRGDAAASTSLGFLYATGQGVAADDRRAAALYQHAADLNNPPGINNLGYMYENGRGLPVDLNMAMTLYKRAADLGERNAVSNLSRIQERLRYQPQPRR